MGEGRGRGRVGGRWERDEEKTSVGWMESIINFMSQYRHE